MLDTFTESDVQILKREVIHKGPIMTFVQLHLRFRLFDGSWSNVITREVLERKAAVAILLYDPALDRVVLIEQFRPGTLTNKPSAWVIEIVAGIIDDGWKPEDIAIREAQEEAGCVTEDLQLIEHIFVSPGGSNEELTIYCGKVDSTQAKGIHGLANENENIRAFTLSVDEALNKLHNHEIKTTPAVIALLWLETNRPKLRAMWQK